MRPTGQNLRQSLAWNLTPMSDIDVVTDASTRLENRLHRTIKCDGHSHARGISGHNPEQHAAYSVLAPCCGKQFNVCESRVLWWWTTGIIRCPPCDMNNLPERYGYTYIGNER